MEFVIRNPTGGLGLGNDTTFVLTLTDNELPPDTVVNANPNLVNANEGDGTVDLTFEVGQLSASGTTFSVDVQLVSGNAADLDNYTTQTVSFPSTGTTTQTLTINITDDALVEGTETFVFELVNPSTGLTLGTTVFDTLVLSDNDQPTYTIAAVTGLDANGQPDSAGVACEITAVVIGVNFANSPDVSFFIHDGTGGMGVYDAGGSAAYTVNEGDEITIQGEVGFFNGLTQLVNISSIVVNGTGTLPAVINLSTPLGEAEEGELVKLSNVTVLDPSDWTGSGPGFNVDVTDGTNTYSVRIDNNVDLYSMALPGCVLDVTGIGTQFDFSSPYTSGYQMLPRYAADISVITPCTAVSITIADATEVDANGEPLLFGSDVTLKGIITSPDFRELQGAGTEFSFADATGGIWAYSTDSTISFNPIVGDSVEVSGEIYASFGVTRIRIASVTSLGAATPWTPTVVATALDESHEAELITIEGLTLQGTWETSGGSYNVSASNANGTYDIRVDADRAELFAPILTGGETFNLTGIGSQYDPTAPRTEGYQILPRFESDIDIDNTNSIQTIELANFSVSPVPANEVLNISFDYDGNEAATIRLINVIGQASLEAKVNLVNGKNKTSVDVSSITPGFYMLQIATEKGVSNTSVLIK
jgi:hypothetical protein